MKNLVIGTICLVALDSFLLSEVKAASDPVAQLLSIEQKMADIITADRDDCSKLASALSIFVSSNKGNVVSLEAQVDALPADQKRKAKDKLSNAFKPIAAKMADGIKKCSHDKGVEKAVSSWEQIRTK